MERKGIELSRSLDIEQVFKRNAQAVYRVCYSFMGNAADAEDATQTTFMRLIDHPREFADEDHERAWLLVVAANVCKDVLKSAARTRVVPLSDDALEPAADQEGGVGIDPARAVEHDDGDAVLKAVRELPEKYREVVFLHYYEGWKTDDIARHLGAPPSTVRNRLRDARLLLKKALGGERA